jgi:hypothetical protein
MPKAKLAARRCSGARVLPAAGVPFYPMAGRSKSQKRGVCSRAVNGYWFMRWLCAVNGYQLSVVGLWPYLLNASELRNGAMKRERSCNDSRGTSPGGGEPSAICRARATGGGVPSIGCGRGSTVGPEPSTGQGWPSPVCRNPATVGGVPSTGCRKRSTVCREPSPGHDRPSPGHAARSPDASRSSMVCHDRATVDGIPSTVYGKASMVCCPGPRVSKPTPTLGDNSPIF